MKPNRITSKSAIGARLTFLMNLAQNSTREHLTSRVAYIEYC
ncbi:hypothetical protein BH10ACI3_BH10ACI3_10790 [soil metagenome]